MANQHFACSCSWTYAQLYEFKPLELRQLLTGVPLTDVPILNSEPHAFAQIYLDFDGAPSSRWDTANVPETPAYDQDGDATTFSENELASIREIWARVSEKYSPFNINVTTIDPGDFGDKHAIHVVIGGNSAWTNVSQAGTAFVGSFYNSYPNTVYVFSALLGNGNPKTTAEAAAHEAGHAFGLQHQSVYSGDVKTQEYNPGNSSTAPILGVSYNATRGLWWYGQSSIDSTLIQDDLSKLTRTTNGFGYRLDDHGNDPAHTDPIAVSGASVSASGIIEQMTDADYFSFTTTGGTASFTVNVAQYGAMLHAKVEIRDVNDNVIASAANANTLGQTISANLAAGTYYLVVKSYGEYGDLGQYTITGTLPSGGPALPVANAGGPYTLAEGGTVQLNGSASTGTSLTYTWDLDGDGIFGETGAAAWYGDETGATPTFRATGLDGPSTYSISLNVTDGFNNVSTTAANVSITNVPPTLLISGVALVKQGSSYALSLSASDPGLDTISKWVINWGDGSSDTITDGRLSVPHTYAARGQYTITASATDEDGTYAANSVSVKVRSPYPMATANPVSLTSPGGSTYQLTVVYFDDLGVNTATLDGSDIRVTGPNSFSQLATFVSMTNDPTTCAAIYRIPAPGGSWDSADNGTYTLTLQANQVANTAGDLSPSSTLASFQVNVPALPVANAGGPYTMAEGGTLALNGSASTGVDLYYAWDLDGDGIFGETGVAALHGDETSPTPAFRAVGLDGSSIYNVTLKITDSFSNISTAIVGIAITNTSPVLTIAGGNSVKVGSSYTLSLSATDPGVDTISKWVINWGDGNSDQITDGRTSVPHTYAARGQYTITANATDGDGTYVANNLDVTVRSAFPSAVANAANITTFAGASYGFTVVYSDDLGINVGTLDNSDIRVTGPNSFDQLATFVSTTNDPVAGTCTATYRILAPGGLWDSADNGTYTLTLQANQVANTAGDLAPSSSLGTFVVVAPALPVAKAGGPYTVTEGGTIQLNASSSTGTNLVYTWDLDGDGVFGKTGANTLHGDEAGPTPMFRAVGLDGPSTYNVTLKVTDSFNNVATTTTTIEITNTPPVLTIAGGNSAKVGADYTLNLSAIDPGVDSINKWVINWGDGSTTEVADGRLSVLHPYSTRGQYTITASATDEDGTYPANNLNVTVRSPYPNAVANLADISTGGDATYQFTVTYAHDMGVNVASLDSNDVLVTGPNEFSQLATFVSAANDVAHGTCTATYRITAPGGLWDATDSGSYALTLQNGQVSNALGDVAPEALLGDFDVNITTLPVAKIGGPYTVAEGGTVQLNGLSSTGANLSYAWDLDGDGLFGETGAVALHGDETGPTPIFQATGLDGPSTYPVSLKVTDDSNNSSTATANVSLTNVSPTLVISGATSVKQGDSYVLDLSSTDSGPDTISKWIINWGDGSGSEEITDGRTSVPHVYASRGQYTITAIAIDDDGTYGANDFAVTVRSGFPKATAKLTNTSVVSGSDYRFTVAYTDDVGLNAATLDGEDIRVTGSNGFSQLATLVSAVEDPDNELYTAIYQITAPNGTWRSSDNGTYTLALEDGQVGNILGDTAPAADLATFDVNVPDTDITPPTSTVTANGLTYGGGTSYTFSVIYRDEVALNIAALDGNEIVVRGPNRYRQSASLVSKAPSTDSKSCTATYRITAPGGFWDPADNGDYWFQVNAGQVIDVAANAMPAGALSSTVTVNIADDGAGTTLRRSRLLKLPAPGKSRTQSGFLIGTNTADYYWFSITVQTRLNAALANMVGNAQLQILDKSGRVVQPLRKYANDPHAFSNYLPPGIYYIRVARVGTQSTGYDLQMSTALVTAAPIVKLASASAFSSQPVAATPMLTRSPIVLAINSARPTSLFGQEVVTY